MSSNSESQFVEKEIPAGVSFVHGSITSDFLSNDAILLSDSVFSNLLPQVFGPYSDFEEHPNPPAFFAFHSELSTHAALWSLLAERCSSENIESAVSSDVFLHNYDVSEPIKVVEFESFQALSDFIEQKTGFCHSENSPAMVSDVFDLFPDIEGFVVLQDAVCSEPEVILNKRGFSKISRQFKTRLGVEEQQARTLDDMGVPLMYREGGFFHRGFASQYRNKYGVENMNKALFQFILQELKRPPKLDTKASRTITRAKLMRCRVGSEMGRVHHAQVGSVLQTFQESPQTSRGRLTRTRSANLEEVLRSDSEKKTPRQGRRR